jgi:hypothetical protein
MCATRLNAYGVTALTSGNSAGADTGCEYLSYFDTWDARRDYAVNVNEERRALKEIAHHASGGEENG